jgi:SAM-dependent methyltransferase
MIGQEGRQPVEWGDAFMSDAAHWESRYQQDNLPWETGHASTELQRVVTEEQIEPCRAIDLGCGSGANAVWLAQRGFEMVGVDFSDTAITRARQRAAEAGVSVQFLCADILAIPDLGPPFRFFFDRGCYHVLHRAGQGSRYVDVIATRIADGGHGLVLAGNAREKQEPGPPVVTEDELRRDWSRHFEFLWLREFRFDQNQIDTSRPLAWAVFLQRR